KQPFIHLNTIFIASNIILHLFHYLAKPLLTVPNLTLPPSDFKTLQEILNTYLLKHFLQLLSKKITITLLLLYC
ncbi:hypothetical protein, partial [Candidatus Cyrtobacter comes]|uniref:hypothetical protein n=1 Tax=Candidatus Cyrtobacter comes TaxID=675776 RepID=UPI002ACDEC1F